MRKTISLFIAFVFWYAFYIVPAHSIDWSVANETTVAWDATTALGDGTPIPIEDLIEYELFLVPYKSTDRENDKVSSGTTQLLEFTFKFLSENRYIAGIRAIRTIAELPEEKTYSPIVWSDSDDVPVPFGFIYLLKPGKVGTFKPK